MLFRSAEANQSVNSERTRFRYSFEHNGFGRVGDDIVLDGKVDIAMPQGVCAPGIQPRMENALVSDYERACHTQFAGERRQLPDGARCTDDAACGLEVEVLHACRFSPVARRQALRG